MRTTDREAIVVGGGPAGALVAWGLARRGWRVTLVDRRRRGEGKCCGHCLHPRGVELLGRLGLAGTLGDRPVTVGTELWIRRATAAAPRRIFAGRLGGGAVVPREEFDAALRDRAIGAGATWIEGSATLVAADGGFEVRVCGEDPPRRPALVIGADGLGSGVARVAGLAPPTAGRRYGFSLSLPAAPGGDDPTVLMMLSEEGYLGSVGDASGSLHLAALVRREAVPAGTPADPAAIVERFRRRFPRLSERLVDFDPRRVRIHATGPLPWRPKAVTGRGPFAPVALVGDAAGYVAPLTGEGMAWAIESATLLLEAIGEDGWSPAAATRYAAAWRRRIGAAHRRCAAVAALADRTGALAALGRAGSRMPGAVRIASWLADRRLVGVAR